MTSKFGMTFSSQSSQVISPGQLPVLAIQIQSLPTPLREELAVESREVLSLTAR